MYGAPETDILPSDFQYKPIKVAADKAGRLFVVSQSFNMGLLEFDREGRFTQTLGAAKVQVTVFDLFWLPDLYQGAAGADAAVRPHGIQ